MREVVRLVETESCLLARDGHYQEAAVNQARGFHIVRHAASDPLLISYLVGNACESITLAGMHSILALAGPSAAISGQVQQATRSGFVPLPLRVPMTDKSAAMEPVFRQLHQGQHQGSHWLDDSLDEKRGSLPLLRGRWIAHRLDFGGGFSPCQQGEGRRVSQHSAAGAYRLVYRQAPPLPARGWGLRRLQRRFDGPLRRRQAGREGAGAGVAVSLS